MTMATILETAAQMVLPVLFDATLKSAAVLAGAWLLTTMLRRRSAATRHLVWSLSMTGCLVLPVLAVIVPAWHLPVSVSWLKPPASITIEEPLPPAGALAELRVDPRPGTAFPSRVESPPLNDSRSPSLPVIASHAPGPMPKLNAISIRSRVVLAWLAGAVLTVMPILLGIVSLRWLRRGCKRSNDGFLTALVGLLAERLGVRRSIVLLTSRRRTIPMTWGVRRPTILLPHDALNWSPQCLRVVLLHELAHIRRGDCVLQFVGHLCRAMYWFNPLAWLALNQLRAEQEKACDDMVLNAGPSAPDYAEHLLAVTTGLPVSRFVAPVALAIGRPRRLECRLRVILDPTRDRRPLGRRATWCFVLVGLLVLASLTPLTVQPAAAKPATTDASAGTYTPDTSVVDERVAEVRALILRNYVRRVDEKNLGDGAIRGMVAALNDPSSEFLTLEQVEELGRGTQGTFAGVGIQIQRKDDQLVVVTPLEGSPALSAGVQPGDVILEIDGQSTVGIDLRTAVRRVLGPRGSTVTLKLRHFDGEELEAKLTRAQIKVASVKGFRRDADERWEYLLSSDNPIAYVAVTHFTSATADDLRHLLRHLKEKRVQGLVVDLRFCPGGVLAAAVEIAEQFLHDGTIVTIKGHDGVPVVRKAEGNGIFVDVPIVVLVNDQTASAAEVLAGALKDNERAVLVGTRTYGKGSVQNLVKIPGDGVLRLTTALFYLPSGRSIQKVPGQKEWGVDPTDGYYFPLDGKQTESLVQVARELDAVGRKTAEVQRPPLTSKTIAEHYADPQLAAALDTLTAKVTKGEFVPVGKPNAAMLEHLFKREDLVKKREALQKELELVNRSLGEIQK